MYLMANICTGTFYSYQSVTTCGTVHSLVCTTSLLVVRVVTVLSELALKKELRRLHTREEAAVRRWRRQRQMPRSRLTFPFFKGAGDVHKEIYKKYICTYVTQ